jgi:hypothetical protein
MVKRGLAVVPSIGAAPEPPIKFNVNVQGLVNFVDANTKESLDDLTVNLNNQVKFETQPVPAEGSLVRAFVNDIVALDASEDLSTVLIVSRGGNYVMRASGEHAGRALDRRAERGVQVRIRSGRSETTRCTRSEPQSWPTRSTGSSTRSSSLMSQST